MPDSPTERFAELVARPEDEAPLDEAALLIAAHAYSGLDVAAQLARIDELAAACPGPSLDLLRHHLFEVHGFRGDAGRYADPRNSYLNDVLDRRVGIPISLSVLTMEVGRRLGVDVAGVGMPGHFLVRSGSVVVDPFGRGRVLDVHACEALFRSIHGGGASFDPEFLAPVGLRAILARMLANLRHLFAAAGDARSLGWVVQLRVLIPADTATDRAGRATDLASLGRFDEAASELFALAEELSDDDAAVARNQGIAYLARLS